MPINRDKQKIEAILTHTVEKIFPSAEFLRKQLLSGKRLTVYLGIDPTGADLHLGHAIQLRKLKQFQELGHQVILLIGDFTGMIGDPTDKTAARVRLSKEQVLENAAQYKKQASKILSFTGENKALIKFNSKWLAKLTFAELIELASHFTVQQMLHRDMFKRRLEEEKEIYLHEFFYPLMQGYDSVAMDVDGEIGATDQTFNMLAGRDLMKDLLKKEKFVITNKLLVDASGKKMGKSEGNMVRLSDTPDEKFGKIMSWEDRMIIPGFALLTELDGNAQEQLSAQLEAGVNPRDIKEQLALDIVRQFDGEKAAHAAQEAFRAQFREGTIPEEMTELTRKKQESYAEVLVRAKLAASKSEARRLVQGSGVKLNGIAVTDAEATAQAGVLQKGKRHYLRLL